MRDLTTARDAFDLPDGVLYLDTASNAPRLRAVDAAGRAAWAAGRMPWRPAMDAWEADVERVRGLASQLFHADARADADAVALLPSVAHGMAIAAAASPLRAGDVVAMLEGEFPSTLLPWQRRCAEAGARLVALPREDATARLLERLGRERLDVLVLSAVHWRDGRVLDLDAIAEAAQRQGVALVLDLSQSLGVLPCDVARWRPAFVASVAYKWLLAGKGLVPLWVAPEWRERVVPLEQHWQQRAPLAPWRFDMDAAPPYRAGARRLDGGEIADPLRLAVLEAGLRQVLEWTPAAIATRLAPLTARLVARLDGAGVGAWLQRPGSPHLIGVAPPPERLTAVRERLMQAQVICTERDGVFRLAPHLHVDEADIDRVADAFVAAR
ncbi:aminotransferase class V-fold PLP-dependent enzyme [Lysobacter humi (ex Lee et al. 2017)]